MSPGKDKTARRNDGPDTPEQKKCKHDGFPFQGGQDYPLLSTPIILPQGGHLVNNLFTIFHSTFIVAMCPILEPPDGGPSRAHKQRGLSCCTQSELLTFPILGSWFARIASRSNSRASNSTRDLRGSWSRISRSSASLMSTSRIHLATFAARGLPTSWAGRRDSFLQLRPSRQARSAHLIIGSPALAMLTEGNARTLQMGDYAGCSVSSAFEEFGEQTGGLITMR